MELKNCQRCKHYLQNITDTTVCRFKNEIYFRPIFNGKIISCPKDEGYTSIRW